MVAALNATLDFCFYITQFGIAFLLQYTHGQCLPSSLFCSFVSSDNLWLSNDSLTTYALHRRYSSVSMICRQLSYLDIQVSNV